MYHFLFVLSSKLFPSYLSKEKKIDSKKEQIIDFCPKCNEQLPDKKVITLLNHDKKFHPKTEKELVRDFYGKGSVQIYMILLIVGTLMLGGFIYGQIDSYFWEMNLTEAEKNAWEFCKDLREKYPDLDVFGNTEQSRIDRSEFVLANVEDLKKCNYTVVISSFGNIDDRIENYLSIDE
jgi:hypothetical protein